MISILSISVSALRSAVSSNDHVYIGVIRSVFRPELRLVGVTLQFDASFLLSVMRRSFVFNYVAVHWVFTSDANYSFINDWRLVVRSIILYAVRIAFRALNVNIILNLTSSLRFLSILIFTWMSFMECLVNSLRPIGVFVLARKPVVVIEFMHCLRLIRRFSFFTGRTNFIGSFHFMHCVGFIGRVSFFTGFIISSFHFVRCLGMVGIVSVLARCSHFIVNSSGSFLVFWSSLALDITSRHSRLVYSLLNWFSIFSVSPALVVTSKLAVRFLFVFLKVLVTIFFSSHFWFH